MALDSINYTYFLLLLMRMSGCVFFNPIFGRKVIPVTIKTGLVLILTVTVYGAIGITSKIEISSTVELVLMIFKELLIGFIIGYIMNLFFGIVALAGEVVGMQMGLSMSQIYDPSSNVSMGLVGTFLNILMMFVFFEGNGHIQLIQIIMTSCKLIEIGQFTIGAEVFKTLVEMFSTMLILSMKLSMSLVAVEIILEAGVGILMNAIPQIQVFTVNVQLKIIIGLILLVILIPSFTGFIEKILELMFDTIKNSLEIIGG